MMLVTTLSGTFALMSEGLSFVLCGLIERYLNKKPIGLQTPLDQSIIDSTRVWNARTIVTDVCFFSGLLYGGFNQNFAMFLLFIESFLIFLVISAIQMTLVLKVTMIFKSYWIQELMDDEIKWLFRIASVVYAGIWWTVSFLWAEPRQRILLILMTADSNEPT